MQGNLLDIEKKLLNRNKWAYSVGGIGRDMIYQLIATFFMTYVQYSGLKIDAVQFGVIGIILIFGRVWDAINDPIMGSIVENTHTKWGKFRPWILIGGLLTAIVVIFMFNFRPEGWSFVVFFGLIYLVWEMTFTLNDIPYWSLIPALSKNKKDRDSITSMVVVFAGIGAFLANAIISFTTTGDMVAGYSRISITFAIFFVACTCLTVFGVKEPTELIHENEEKITIKKMFAVIKNNDQLLWSALALMFYSVGSGILVALGYNFFYIELGYNGTLILIFLVTFAISNITIQAFYSKLANRFSRKTLMKASFIVLAVGYGLLLIVGFVPFIPMHIATVSFFGFFVFSGQAIFYMVIIVNMTNTIEYNEFKTGDRNEAIVFSLRPFVAKFSSALQQGVVTLVLLASGVFVLSQNISELENQKNIFDQMDAIQQAEYLVNISARQGIFDNSDLDEEQIEILYDALEMVEFEGQIGAQTMIVNSAADFAFKDLGTLSMRVMLRIALAIVPVVLIYISYWILNKKFIITEEYYEQITSAVKQKYAQDQSQET